ncbi:MAG: hypothetical protein KDJ77_16390 [Rhodobiaceae bacterium]|nr:hypothetical protein [Rhodobiaceae bacterium]
MTTFSTKSLVAAVAVAASIFAATGDADARDRGHGARNHAAVTLKHRGHDRHWNGHGRWGHGGYIYVGNPHRSCHFLKKKARYTGSRYWWNQYRLCVDGYYY